MNEIEIRAAQLGEVNFPKRMIELVVMPYETETRVVHLGREITEICSRGAYDGVDLRTRRIRVNRDHNISDVIGKAVALHPSREEGLVAEIRIADSREFDKQLVLAEEGMLDASAGFGLMRKEGRVVPDAEVWETRDRRRLNHLFLHHIALTPDPAYEDARVLAVRNAQEAAEDVPTPNRDWIRVQGWLEVEADLDARYGLSR